MLESLQNLIGNLNTYLLNASAPMSRLEYIAVVICPIISTGAIILGGGFALCKYFFARNYDMNLKILNEVYVPLYSYLVKQETFRFIACPENVWNESPILELTITKKKQSASSQGIYEEIEMSDVCGCKREQFLQVLENTNLGMAPSSLVTLLNAYKMVTFISSGTEINEQKAKALIIQKQIELELRKEIIKGYKFYQEKLKLRKSKTKIFSINDKQINFKLSISDDEVSAMITKLKQKK